MMQVRLEPAALRSRVKHSTTEPLRCLVQVCEIELSHIGKNNKNPDLVCEKNNSLPTFAFGPVPMI